MEDDVRPAYRRMRALVRPQVALDKADIETLQALAPTRGEVVENSDLVAVRQKSPHEVMTDEAATAGD